MTEATEDQGPALACSLEALSPAERERHTELLKGLARAVLETQELEEGYAFRLPADATMIRDLAEWVTLERTCCPFLAFSIEVMRNRGAVWLHLTGSPGAKQFIGATLLPG